MAPGDTRRVVRRIADPDCTTAESDLLVDNFGQVWERTYSAYCGTGESVSYLYPDDTIRDH